jgi:RNA polymerase sigma-70 factor (ECF subfamily)
VALNRAVALAEAGGVEEALGIVEDLDLKRNHSYHAVRGELLFRLGRNLEAADSFAAAMELATNTAELNLLSKRRSRCLAESLRLT